MIPHKNGNSDRWWDRHAEVARQYPELLARARSRSNRKKHKRRQRSRRHA